jgi:DNA-binding transcriptional LysR family regulator
MDRLRSMETLVTVVESGSFSSATRRLEIGQPAVSKTIAQLEDRLGVELLLRATRGLTPTEADQNFCERARRSIEEADEVKPSRGAGRLIASEWMFWPERESGSVKRALEEWQLPPMDLWAVFPTGRMASAKTRAFVAFVEGVLRGDQG